MPVLSAKKTALLASCGLVTAAAIWGFAFVIVKDSLDYVGAVWEIAFRFSIAALLLAAIYAKKLPLLDAAAWRHGIVLGSFLFLAYFLQTIGCKYTTAGKNAFLTTIYVILVPLFGWALGARRPGWHVFVAALLAVAGIALLALPDGGTSLLAVNNGDILTLACGIFYALHICFVARYAGREDPVLLTVLQFAVAALLGWLSAPFVDGAFPAQAAAQPRVIMAMLYLGVFSTMVAFVLQNLCLKYVPSALAALLLSLESVFGVLFGTAILKEQLSARMWLGCALIFAAILGAEVVPKLGGTTQSDTASA